MKQSSFNTVAGTLFGVVALVHALRLYRGWEFTLGGWHAPLWASWAGLAVAGFLTFSAFRLKNER